MLTYTEAVIMTEVMLQEPVSMETLKKFSEFFQRLILHMEEPMRSIYFGSPVLVRVWNAYQTLLESVT